MSDSNYILREVLLTLGPGTAKLGQKIVLYRGDYGVKLRFNLKDSQYKFNGSDKATIFEGNTALISVYKPSGEQFIVNEEVVVEKESIDVLISKEFCDELTEIGSHSLQFHIFDRNNNRVSYEPIEFEVRQSLIDEPNVVGTAQVDGSIIRIALVDEEGNYIEYEDVTQGYTRTRWKTGDTISAVKLNNIESGINISFESINDLNDKVDNLALCPSTNIIGTVDHYTDLEGMTANPNDAYIANNNNRVYVYTVNGDWVDAGYFSVLQGPQGEQGEQGDSVDVVYGSTPPENINALWVVDDENCKGEVVTSQSVNRIEIVVGDYPSVLEENVLYIKVTGDSNA